MKIFYAPNNLRRLTGIPDIELRPITILVGKNSAGKSTYLRSLPLFRQSIQTETSAPILWNGDYVDFGNFKSAAFHQDVTNDIIFRFKIEEFEATVRKKYSVASSWTYNEPISIDSVSVKYALGQKLNRTVRKSIDINVSDISVQCRIEFEKNGEDVSKITVLETDITFEFEDITPYLHRSNLFSSPEALERTTVGGKLQYRSADIESYFGGLIFKVLRPIISKQVKDDSLKSEARRILQVKRVNQITLPALQSNTRLKTFKNFYESLNHDSNMDVCRFLDACAQASYAFEVLGYVGETLTEHFENVRYLAPARASSERFYRQQEVSVSEIAPNGSNFPMFLAALNKHQQERFSNWVRSIFGYGVEVTETEGHISINMTIDGEQPINVVDTGYGVSQVLPVLGQIWWAGEQRTDIKYRRVKISDKKMTLAIEQPELHLHPAHQALLADVLADAVSNRIGSKRAGPSINFLIETHSEALINRIGELIDDEKIDAGLVQIVIFSTSKDEQECADVKVSNFSDNGTLMEWPYGFFNY